MSNKNDRISLIQILDAAKDYSQIHPELDRKYVLDLFLELQKLANILLEEGWTRDEIFRYVFLSDEEAEIFNTHIQA